MSLVDSSGHHCYSEHERLNLQVAFIFLSSEINSSPEPRSFALIILGINDYMHYDKLFLVHEPSANILQPPSTFQKYESKC